MKGRVTDEELLRYNLKVDTMGVWISAILSCILCIGGVALLIFNPPVWGIVLGLPYSIGGLCLAYFSFDRVNRPRADSEIDRQDLQDERDFLSQVKLKK